MAEAPDTATGSGGGPRVALLTNFIAPYRAPVLRALEARLAGLRILLSTPMESRRGWAPDWAGLDVEVQRGLTVPRSWRHPGGFTERLPLHIPLDTHRRLDQFEPDVVIAGELGARTFQAARWCVRRHRPLIIWAMVSERTELGRGPVRRLLRRFLLRRAAAVIVNGESGARYLRRLGYPEERIHRINQASAVAWPEIEHEAADAGSPRPLKVIVVGQLVERKGVEGLLRGLRSWCDSRRTPLHVTIVGAGPLRERLSVVEPGELLAVRFEGEVPFHDLAGHYASADLLAFPTLADEWGLVVNEAMACGLPVLGSIHAQAVTELVDDGETGWRYDPDQPGDLAAALDRIAAAGPAELRRMGAEARRRMTRLTPESMADRLLQTIDDVAGYDPPRP